jgi:mono/diheme cytochrome c family protein
MLLGNIAGMRTEISAHAVTFLCDPMRPLSSQLILILSLQAAGAEEPVSFNDEIQPLMSETCYHCHGPDSGTREPKDEPLRLDRPEFAFAKRANGKPAIIPGKPEESLIIQLMRSKDPDKVMPPPKAHRQLKPAELALIERWVREGAKFEEHWAFVPPVKKSPAPVDGDIWSRNEIDRFILEKLKAKRLTPAPPEDPRTLIRRASLDLTGLLPDPADVDAFVANPNDAAYEAYLDKLLASPRYAEHRTRYWLDYVRYSDTHGLHFDNVRSIWPYRDYLIRSFQQNKPFDRFVMEQLAGDLLPARNVDDLIATGYIRANVSTNEGGTIPEEIQVSNTRDRAEAFGAAFMGLTVGCAACHDHKFDPTSTKDFYSLGAFFNNTAEKSWDENIHDPAPVLRIPATDKLPTLEAAIARRHEPAAKYEELRRNVAADFARRQAEGLKATPVSTDAMQLRFRFDEGKGDTVVNSAPEAKTKSYQVDTNPLVWGENSWLWPSMRMDISSKLPLPDQGDFEANQPFSLSFWTMARMKTGNQDTGTGGIVSRMGDSARMSHRGWDLFCDGSKYVIHIIHQWPQHAIRVESEPLPRGVWRHIGFTYDGSSKAAGVKLYVDGKPVPLKITNDTLQPGQSIRTDARMHVGRREDEQPLRESRYQDLRLYSRALSMDEFGRLPFEDLASEVISREPDPAKWTTDERFIVLDRWFLNSANPDAARLKEELARIDAEIGEITKDGVPTMVAKERESPAYANILDRGVYTSRKERVTPATPHFLPPMKADLPSNRLGLAKWLLQDDQPLLGRVTVNRMWQELFGTGIVETADDFGIMGTRPSHGALLDWMAVDFRESGWDMRRLYKLMLTSATYRQSTVVTDDKLVKDDKNRLLSRGPRFRMDAEVLRDTALQASGLLVEKTGGPPVKPYQPPGVWEAVSMPESNTKEYHADKGENLYRRSMYAFWKRFAPPPSLETFDAQAREVVCTRRTRTNTPLQALVTMNDPQFVEAARKLAERAIKAGADDATRLDFMAQATLSRHLTKSEMDALSKSVERFRTHFTGSPDDAAALLTTGDSLADAALPAADIATWAMVANQFLNLDEYVTK